MIYCTYLIYRQHSTLLPAIGACILVGIFRRASVFALYIDLVSTRSVIVLIACTTVA